MKYSELGDESFETDLSFTGKIIQVSKKGDKAFGTIQLCLMHKTKAKPRKRMFCVDVR